MIFNAIIWTGVTIYFVYLVLREICKDLKRLFRG